MLTGAHMGSWQPVLHNSAVWIFTTLLAVCFPVADYLLYFRLKSTLQIYLWTIIAEWSLTGACLCIAFAHSLNPESLGERPGHPERSIIVASAIAIIIAILMLAGKRKKGKLGNSAKIVSPKLLEQIKQVRRFLPTDALERKIFIAVAITAGVCEEFLYRGWLLNLSTAASGSVWLGLLISSILFGIAHAYQGRQGIMGTAFVGCVFGIIYIFTGSLLLSQLLHTAMDITNGISLGRAAAKLEAS